MKAVPFGAFMFAELAAMISMVSLLPWTGSVLVAAIAAVLVFGALLINVAGRRLTQWAATCLPYLRGSNFDPGITMDFREHATWDFADDAADAAVGIHWGTTTITTVVQLTPRGSVLTTLTKDSCVSEELLPLDILAESLVQHDVSLDGIDVISHGRRTTSNSDFAGVYERLLGPLPATAVRTVWLAIRLRHDTCADAIVRRGGGTLGASRTARIATARIVRALEVDGCPARALSAAEINFATDHLTGSTDPGDLVSSWSHLTSAGEVHTSFIVAKESLDSAALTRLWAPRARHTTLTLQLRPSRIPGQARLGGLVRYSGPVQVPAPAGPALISLNGRQHAGLVASLPVGDRDAPVISDLREFTRAELAELTVANAGCGQVLGSDSAGRAVAVRVAAPEVASVTVFGRLHLIQQVVLRALATGGRVLLHTDRPHAWQSMVDSIAEHSYLAISRADSSERGRTGAYSVLVFDGVERRHAGQPGTTVLTVVPDLGTQTDPGFAQLPPADVMLMQIDGQDRLLARAGGRTMELAMVTITEELAFVGRPDRQRASSESSRG